MSLIKESMLAFAILMILWASILIIEFTVGLIIGLRKHLKGKRTILINRKDSDKSRLN